MQNPEYVIIPIIQSAKAQITSQAEIEQDESKKQSLRDQWKLLDDLLRFASGQDRKWERTTPQLLAACKQLIQNLSNQVQKSVIAGTMTAAETTPQFQALYILRDCLAFICEKEAERENASKAA